jgi:hypothetical protein
MYKKRDRQGDKKTAGTGTIQHAAGVKKRGVLVFLKKNTMDDRTI